VLVSFARHADPSHHLVFKHHPMGRGQRDYRRLFGSLSEDYGLTGRVHDLHDVHLPTLLRHSRGVVTINSTVGLSALYHDKPLRVMGRAMYDLLGLTFQGPLAQFWVEQNQIDKVLWRRYHAFLVRQTQLNGAFFWPRFLCAGEKDGRPGERPHARTAGIDHANPKTGPGVVTGRRQWLRFASPYLAYNWAVAFLS
jgi:capsule polysaccharide modification protein KpsS